MALVTCGECGKQVSSKAPACPSCGAPLKPKRDLISSMARWFVIIFLVIPIGIGIFTATQQSGGRSSSVGTARAAPVRDPTGTVKLDYRWSKEGFGNVMEIDATLTNTGKTPVKDVTITCTHFSNSGTRIDSNERTIYERIEPGAKKRVPGFNMGFIHSQATRSSCEVTDVVAL